MDFFSLFGGGVQGDQPTLPLLARAVKLGIPPPTKPMEGGHPKTGLPPNGDGKKRGGHGEPEELGEFGEEELASPPPSAP